MRVLTFDIETVGEFLGNGDFSNLDVAVVGVHDSATDAYTYFLKDDLPKLWQLFERADIVVGYNSEHFDLPILNRFYPGDLTKIKSVDLLKEVKNVLGRRLKLDNLAEATLGRKKSGNGLEAQKWWADGLIQKVCDYCLEDVRITRALYDYAKKNSSLKYKDYDGVREIKLDTSQWEVLPHNGPALTHTLPF
jgi:DEAD/DEAH box helicase domain-containing protein